MVLCECGGLFILFYLFILIEINKIKVKIEHIYLFAILLSIKALISRNIIFFITKCHFIIPIYSNYKMTLRGNV